MSVNSRLKDTEIIGQMKAFYRQRISGSSRAIKEFNVDIFVTSKNGDRKIMESISTKSKSSSFSCNSMPPSDYSVLHVEKPN